jgi:hypothetical protein
MAFIDGPDIAPELVPTSVVNALFFAHQRKSICIMFFSSLRVREMGSGKMQARS